MKFDGSFILIWMVILSNLKDKNEEIRVIFKIDDSELRCLLLFVWEIFFEECYYCLEMGLYLFVEFIFVEFKNY